MASYPDGNGNGAGANGAAHPRHPSLSPNPPLHAPTAQQHQLPPPQYDASAVAQATINAAHHGLHALQAATLAGAPVSATSPGPAASVYPPLNSPPPHSEPQFSPHNGLSPNTAASAARQTRLRRACDMCSNRKVKVSFPSTSPHLRVSKVDLRWCPVRRVGSPVQALRFPRSGMQV